MPTACRRGVVLRYRRSGVSRCLALAQSGHTLVGWPRSELEIVQGTGYGIQEFIYQAGVVSVFVCDGALAVAERANSPTEKSDAHQESLFQGTDGVYQARPVPFFRPSRIVLAKGANTAQSRRALADRICDAYPDAEVVEAFGIPHNRIALGESDPLRLHSAGKRTLVLAEHKSAVRHSEEEGNTCPNYWHFSPYGFCPYGCDYCYLAGTQGIRFSPTVKVFLNLPEILDEIDRIARRIGEPTAFYLGKLQDGLALDPLTGYSRRLIAFFAGHPYARMTLLTKSAAVDNLLDLDHRKHSILSWTVNPPEIADTFEQNTPPVADRVAAMRRCADAGYPVRAVVMPIVPLPNWQEIYRSFLRSLLEQVGISRITLGSICSYPQAIRLMEMKLGKHNPVSTNLDGSRRKSADGRARFPHESRECTYRFLLRTIHQIRPRLDIGLCLEAPAMFDALEMRENVGRCNCVL